MAFNRWALSLFLWVIFISVSIPRCYSDVRVVRYLPNSLYRFDNENTGEGKTFSSGGSLHRNTLVGTVIDSTIFDFQGYGTLPRRVVAIGDSALHLIAAVSHDETMRDRGTKYSYYFDSQFTNFGYISTGSGFGSLTGYGLPGAAIGNVAVIATTIDFFDSIPPWASFHDAFQGLGAFSCATVDPGDVFDACDQVYFPAIYSRNNIDGDMAMCGITLLPCSGGFPDIIVTHLEDGIGWIEGESLPTMDDSTLWNSDPNVPMIGGSDDGRVAIATTDFGTNVYTWESSDGGVTWGNRASITGYPPDPERIPPDSTSTEYRPLQNAAVEVSPGGVPHVVWTEYQARGNPSDSIYTPGVDGLWQYRTRLQHWDPVHGITTIYQYSVGLSDQAYGTAFSYNIGHPTIGFGESDEVIYVVTEGFVDSDRDLSNGFYFGDLYVSFSTDGGATWGDRVNVTNSPGSDDLYPSITRINLQGAFEEIDGYAVGGFDGVNDFTLLYQNDEVAGTFLMGDEPVPNFDWLLVASVDFAAIEPAGFRDRGGNGENEIPKTFALFQNYPNPFNPSTSIDYRVSERSLVKIEIFDLRGRLVRMLVNEEKETGEYAIRWNGKNRAGETVSSGIYLYKMKTGRGVVSIRKMIVLK